MRNITIGETLVQVYDPDDPHPDWCPLDAKAGGPTHADGYVMVGYQDDPSLEVTRDIETFVYEASRYLSEQASYVARHLVLVESAGEVLAVFGLDHEPLARVLPGLPVSLSASLQKVLRELDGLAP